MLHIALCVLPASGALPKDGMGAAPGGNSRGLSESEARSGTQAAYGGAGLPQARVTLGSLLVLPLSPP